MKTNGRAPAFTLLEMLVVVAIIGILACFSVPALNAAIKKTQSAKCLSNLRQLGAALSMFAIDHENQLPNVVAIRTSTSDPGPAIDTVLAPYLTNQNVLICPSDRSVGRISGTSYYWNSSLGARFLHSLSFFMETSLSAIPLLADKEGWHDLQENKVNFLYADGHASSEFSLFELPD